MKFGSVPDKGSRFTVTINFRLVDEQSVSAEATVDMVLKLLNKRKILLVDDNEINLEIASERFRMWELLWIRRKMGVWRSPE